MAGRKPLQQGSSKDLRMRRQLAQEAARLIAEEGISDFHVAKQKAALRLHAPHTHNLPRNDEIQLALREYQRLFKADSHAELLTHLRHISAQAMGNLHQFKPRLVGEVVDGTANEYSQITLHLFSDFQEEVALFLDERHIPYQQWDETVTQANGETQQWPAYQVLLEETPILLVVFDYKEMRQAPRHPATGRPMERLNLEKVEALIQGSN